MGKVLVSPGSSCRSVSLVGVGGLVLFKNTTRVECSLRRTWPPSSLICRQVPGHVDLVDLRLARAPLVRRKPLEIMRPAPEVLMKPSQQRLTRRSASLSKTSIRDSAGPAAAWDIT